MAGTSYILWLLLIALHCGILLRCAAKIAGRLAAAARLGGKQLMLLVSQEVSR